jgi:hypothetical protein
MTVSRKSNAINNGEPAPSTSPRIDASSQPKLDPATLDPFSPENLRLASNLSTAGSVKKILSVLRIGKPGASEWVRVHPSENYRTQVAVLEVQPESKIGTEAYVIPHHLQDALCTDPCFRTCLIALTVTRQNDPFLWRINLPREGQKTSDWTSSALDAIDRATRCWVRVAAKKGYYEILEAGTDPEPTWPELSITELLRIAFRERFIDSMEHTIVRELHGRV